ncbi:helix-turn-helix transcriptional regulator [Natronomonas marina]|uniref:helix-turn-helix transcriptional regulator n=1 Tax=Natronomonas marina TaxID=2961939 RepID=UPI003D9C9BDE
MTENTEELRDIFKDVADEDTVTETQEEPRGSLTAERASEERLVEIVERMRADHEFETALSDEELAGVVERFYEGDSDAAIADALDVSRRDVFRARMDLHLVRDRDTDPPFELTDLRELLAEEYPTSEIAERLDVFRARMDLHLVRDRDTDPPFELTDLRELLAEEYPTSEIAERLDVSASTVRRYRRVVEAQNESRRVSERFQSEFEDVLLETEMSEQFTDDVAEDGLEEATEGTETNVSF